MKSRKLPLPSSLRNLSFIRPAPSVHNSMEQQGKSGVITLRRFDLADVDDYMVWASDDRVAAFCSWETYTDKEELLRYTDEVVLPHPWLRAICLDGSPIGAINVELGAGRDRCRGELGYVLASAHWGNGYATAAVRAAVGAVFGEVEGLERVEALVDVQNKASQRQGLPRKGSTRDMIIFSFLNTDPLLS